MTEKLLLECILLLLTCVVGFLGYGFRKHDKLHDHMNEEIDALREQRSACNNAFATKESVRRAHTRIDEGEARLDNLSTRVTVLESRGKDCGRTL